MKATEKIHEFLALRILLFLVLPNWYCVYMATNTTDKIQYSENKSIHSKRKATFVAIFSRANKKFEIIILEKQSAFSVHAKNIKLRHRKYRAFGKNKYRVMNA